MRPPITPKISLTPPSAKELEHFERIRDTFEAVDKSKQDSSAAAPQTIAEAMEAFNLGGGAAPVEDAPSSTGERTPTGSVRGRIKTLNKWPGALSRSASGQSTTSSKGKGKSSRKGKGKSTAESDGSVDGDEEGMTDGNLDGDDDYLVRTDHLAIPREQAE